MAFKEAWKSAAQGDSVEKSKFLETYGHLTSDWDVLYPSLKESLTGKESWGEADHVTSTRSFPKVDLRIKSRYLKMRLLLAVRKCRALAKADEYQHFYSGLYVQKSRELLKAVAKDLLEEGLLRNHDDIYFLSATELEKHLLLSRNEFMSLAEKRRLSFTNPDELPAELNIRMRSRDLTGLGASSGQARGKIFLRKSGMN